MLMTLAELLMPEPSAFGFEMNVEKYIKIIVLL